MHDTFQMREHRNPRFALHQTDQTLATARHNYINVSSHLQHLTYGSTIARWHPLNGVFRQSRSA